jgi:hypothetical protein
MKLSLIYLLIMWVWVIGAWLWTYVAATKGEPRFLWVAGVYGLVGILNGFTALAYQHSGR